jgi:lipopolysaccharide export system protein LptA
MRPRLVLSILGASLVMAGACRSGGPRPRGTAVPAPAPTPVNAPVDTAATRAAADSTVKAREDSIKAASQTPPTKPADSVAAVPPKVESAPAPERRCILDLPNTPVTRVQIVTDASGKRFTYAGGGIVGNCRGQDINITADSAESYEGSDLHILIGNVNYREAKYTITSRRATYYKNEERLVFQDSVRAQMTKDAATLEGPHLEYLRAISGLREQARVIATQRPRLTYVEKDSSGKELPPVIMLGNVIIGEGDSTFFAVGDVRIERTDVLATGDSAMFDGARRFSRLMKGPVVESKGEDPFTLKGRVIDMFAAEETRELNRVVAIDSANAVSSDFDVDSDTIDLRLEQKKLTRAFAFGPSGARATSPARDIIADSMDIIMPNQQIRELRAVGKAFAESDPDTVKIKSIERDWIRGDTLIALFDSIAATDTMQPDVRELFASGQASAFYQVATDSAQRDRPGLNYVVGRVIRLAFKDKEVETVTVTDQVSGVYLAPLPADSVGRRPPGTRPPENATRRPPRPRPLQPAPGKGPRP